MTQLGARCSTWSMARWRRPRAPAPRVREFTDGGDSPLPEVSVKDKMKLENHTLIFQGTFELCLIGHQSVTLTISGLENPEDMGRLFA